MASSTDTSSNNQAWQDANVVTERYLELLANAKVKGYLFEQQNYFSKDGAQQ